MFYQSVIKTGIIRFYKKSSLFFLLLLKVELEREMATLFLKKFAQKQYDSKW